MLLHHTGTSRVDGLEEQPTSEEDTPKPVTVALMKIQTQRYEPSQTPESVVTQAPPHDPPPVSVDSRPTCYTRSGTAVRSPARDRMISWTIYVFIQYVP